MKAWGGHSLIKDLRCSSLAGEICLLSGFGEDMWVVFAGGWGGGGINELELGSQKPEVSVKVASLKLQRDYLIRILQVDAEKRCHTFL